MTDRTPRLLVHGGAGVPPPERLAPEIAAAARRSLQRALEAGEAILAAGGAALDAVEAAVRAMEEDETFNAGIGAALTSAGVVEHDAAIMRGSDRAAGASTGTRRVRSPIQLARRILEEGRHVMMAGAGAEEWAARQGLALVAPETFVTERQRQALARVRDAEARPMALTEQDRHGTVGAVALDARGHLAAATSTGGFTNKRPGRIGDTPIIGAGTYADDRTVAVSCTGHGEYYIRIVLAHRIAALIELAGLDVAAAADRALAELAAIEGTGGLIALAPDGSFTMPYNTPGMYRGAMIVGGRPEVAIY